MKKLIEWFKDLLNPSFTGAHNNPEDSLRIDEVAVRELAKEPTVTAAEVTAILDSASGPSPNFTWREVACRDKDRTLPTGEHLSGAYRAAVTMELIRDHFGGKPITVNSWYRTPEYNRQVGGAKNSAHMQGHAADFTVAGVTPRQVQASLKKAIASGKLDIGGLGCYTNFTHIDLGRRRTWEG